jgi:hypothetical protein
MGAGANPVPKQHDLCTDRPLRKVKQAPAVIGLPCDFRFTGLEHGGRRC